MRPEYEKAFRDEEPQTREARLLEWARENLIERTLLTQEARGAPEPIPDNEINRVIEDMQRQQSGPGALPGEADDELKAAIELRLRIQRTLENVCKGLPSPSEDAIRRYHSDHVREFMAPPQVHAAHIVKHVDVTVDPATAQATLARVREEIVRGADFAEMAREHSDCPENGGDLGFFARGQMVEEFEDRVFAMAAGQISEVFPTRFGYHIVKVIDRKPSAPYRLNEIKDHVKERLTREIRDKAIEKYLDRLRAKAAVEEAE